MPVEMQSLEGTQQKDDDRVAHHGMEGDESNRDTMALARSGKKQVLTVNTLSLERLQHPKYTKSTQRRFGLVSMTGFSCGLMCTWEGMLV